MSMIDVASRYYALHMAIELNAKLQGPGLTYRIHKATFGNQKALFKEGVG